jgi:hypothetical protein
VIPTKRQRRLPRAQDFRRKDSAVKNLAGALHADRVGCTLQVVRAVKMEIPVNKDAVVHEDRFV